MRILTAKYLLPITSNPIENGAIAIRDQVIDTIGTKEEVLKKYPSADVSDFPQAVIMPGLVNSHAHLDLLSFQGTGETPQFFDWLVQSWDHRKAQTLAARRQCLEQGIPQLLRSGTTCVGDVGEFYGLVSQCINSPMRMVLFPEILTGGEKNMQEHYEGAFSQVEEIMATKSGRISVSDASGAGSSASSRISAGLAPYATYTLSRHFLKILSRQASELKIPIKIHVSETFSEMQFFFESSGEIAEKIFPRLGWGELPPAHRKTPIQFLESIGFLESSPILVGGNHLSEPDIQLIAKTKSKVVHAPRMGSFLKIGQPSLRKLLDNKITVSLGTDITSSIHSLSLWDEMRFILDHYESEKPTPEELLKMATLGGAKTLGLDRKIGSIDEGKEADIAVIRVPQGTTLDKLPLALIQSATPREVMEVLVQGQKVKIH